MNKKKKKRYFDPGLLGIGYDDKQKDVVQVDDDVANGDEEEMTEVKKRINLAKIIKDTIDVSRKRNFQKSGYGPKVYLTKFAPEELTQKSADGSAWLVSTDPLAIRFDTNTEETIPVESDWIIFERKKLSSFVNFLVDSYMGNIQISEYGNATDVLAYDPSRYNSPDSAYVEFKAANKELSINGSVDLQTVKNFLKNNYKSGDHNVELRAFVDYLVKKGIRVTDRRENKIADLEVFDKKTFIERENENKKK